MSQVLVSSLYPLVFDSPPVFRLTTRFFVLLCPIGVLGFLSQALMTMGLIKEKAGRGALATCTSRLRNLPSRFSRCLPDDSHAQIPTSSSR